ncbi:hypothetical protein DM860_016795 [Cuscuta australis]|uniref:Uncharacterized protein n=1 Tax=Cuscuta australis TaxID=267555 RepID=A0A328E085_9ASTE|nr:hypothetical protein DM860_016795 [Cuscuta australis]
MIAIHDELYGTSRKERSGKELGPSIRLGFSTSLLMRPLVAVLRTVPPVPEDSSSLASSPICKRVEQGLPRAFGLFDMDLLATGVGWGRFLGWFPVAGKEERETPAIHIGSTLFAPSISPSNLQPWKLSCSLQRRRYQKMQNFFDQNGYSGGRAFRVAVSLRSPTVTLAGCCLSSTSHCDRHSIRDPSSSRLTSGRWQHR